MSVRHGHFVWFELVTPDVADGVRFWTKVADLGTQEMPMGPGATYRMLARGEKAQCGVVEPQMPGVPPHFLAYLSVPDVDAALVRVAARGGQVIVPGTDLPVGRFAIATDPHGAVFALFTGADPDDDGATAFGWCELWSKDAAGSVAFYADVFGFGHREMAMPTGAYHVLEVDGRAVAGVMASSDRKVPPMWLPYLEVDDTDAAVARVRAGDGAVHAAPMSVDGVGRFAVVADRQGAVLGLLKPAPR